MQPELPNLASAPCAPYHASAELFRYELEDFHVFGTPTDVGALTTGSGETISVFTNE
jgi:hypothetical protein